MSGWTTATINLNPGGRTKKFRTRAVLLDAKDKKMAKEDVKNRLDDIIEPIEGDDAIQQAIRNELEKRYEDKLGISFYLSSNGGIIFTLPGYDMEEQAKKWSKSVMSEGDRVVIVNANDTSDSGEAILYEFKTQGLEEMDRKQGYEQARGKDAVGYMQENYNVIAYTEY